MIKSKKNISNWHRNTILTLTKTQIVQPNSSKSNRHSKTSKCKTVKWWFKVSKVQGNLDRNTKVKDLMLSSIKNQIQRQMLKWIIRSLYLELLRDNNMINIGVFRIIYIRKFYDYAWNQRQVFQTYSKCQHAWSC